MNLSRWALWGGVAAGLGGLGLFALALHGYMTGAYRGEGASAEQARECCDRIHRLEENEETHGRDAEKWKQKILDGDDKDAWQDRRLDSADTERLQIRELLGEIRGQMNELLRRTPAHGGPVKPSGNRLSLLTTPRQPADTVDELLRRFEGGAGQ